VGGIVTFARNSISCVSADKISNKDIKPQTGGTMKDSTKSQAFTIMKNLDSKTTMNMNIASNNNKNNDYLFKGFVFYKSCNAMDATFFGG